MHSETEHARQIHSTDRPPVRIVHLGLGAFHRAHQAWYTHHGAPGWGIAAFTGRGPAAAEALAASDGRYTLVTRGPEGDAYETISSIVAAHDASETARLCAYLADPAVTVVTLTITEKGYRLDSSGALDADDPDVASDIAALRAALAGSAGIADGMLRTMPGRLVWGLAARRRAAPASGLAVIPCDNLSDNGTAARAGILGMASHLSPELAGWIDEWIDIIGTSVDRITPRTTSDDVDRVAAATGVRDHALVVTEPFSSWILHDRFRAARPEWERAGAVFVDDVRPFENRKLWMLNGAHSLLAYEGIARGYDTVAQAIADPACLRLVRDLWDLDTVHLRAHDAAGALRPDEYRHDLEERFRNPAIAHHLRQIAVDGSVKLPNRVLEVIALDRAAGGTGRAALAVIAAWIRFVVGETSSGRTLDDVAAASLAAAAAADEDAATALLRMLDAGLAADAEVRSELAALLS